MRYLEQARVGLFGAMVAAAAACGSRGSDCELNGDCESPTGASVGGGGASSSSSSNRSSAHTSSGHGGSRSATSTGSTGEHATSSGTGGKASTSSTSSASKSSSGAGAGGSAPACGATPATTDLRDADCAIFVDASASGGNADGTPSHPYSKLAAAIAAASAASKPVYACGSFDEAVSVAVDFELWGGFDCSSSTWTWQKSARTKWAAAADKVPLSANGHGDVKLHNLQIKAAAPNAAGGSSIGILFGAYVVPEIGDSSIATADGKAGTSSQSPAAAPDAKPAKTQANTNQCGTTIGGKGDTVTCHEGANVAGDGGNGGKTVNQSGQVGGDGIINGTRGGLGGNGGSTTNACTAGGKGADGATAGAPGAGGTQGAVTFHINGSPITGGDGADGTDGDSGFPGGGGGGEVAESFSSSCMMGGAGAAGATGACGGLLAKGGQAGGSSIGIVCLGPTLALTNVAITTGNAGKGGDGAAGGAPGTPVTSGARGSAAGYNGGRPGCDGGAGGAGQPGGAGGGGRGGSALSVVFAPPTGTTATLTSDAQSKLKFGVLGSGGTAPLLTHAGEDGLSGSCYDFVNQARCN